MAGEPTTEAGLFKVPALPQRKVDEYPPLNYEAPSDASQPRHQFTMDVIKDGSFMDTFTIPLGRSYSTFGRLPICDYSMDHVSISRYHAVLQFTADQPLPTIVDLGSSHGTFVNKQQIRSRIPQTLCIGDQIRFGASSRVWILGSSDPIEPPMTDGDKERKPADKSVEYRGDPVKYLKSVLRDIGHEYCPETPARNEDAAKQSRLIAVRIGLPMVDESGDTVYATAQAPSQLEAEKQACLLALEELDKHGYLDTQSGYQLDDDGDQEKQTSNNDVETFDTLTHKLRLVREDICRVKGELDTALQPDEEEEDVDDVLDAYMSTLARGEKLDSQKKLSAKLEDLIAQESRLNALLKIVAPDHIDPLPSPTKPTHVVTAPVKTAPAKTAPLATTATKPTAQSAKRRVHSPPRKDPSEITLPAKHAKTNIDDDVNVSWQPPSNQSGDGRTSLNDKYGY